MNASGPAAGPGLQPGYNESKWRQPYQKFAVRMARQGMRVLLPDHAPFGETTQYQMR